MSTHIDGRIDPDRLNALLGQAVVELAQRTGTAERYIREWLSAQAASGAYPAAQTVIPRMSSFATGSGSLNTSIATARSPTTVNASTANGRSPSNAIAPAAPLTSAGRTYGAKRRAVIAPRATRAGPCSSIGSPWR